MASITDNKMQLPYDRRQVYLKKCAMSNDELLTKRQKYVDSKKFEDRVDGITKFRDPD